MSRVESTNRTGPDDVAVKATALARWTRDRGQLLLEQPLLATLALQLRLCPVVDERVPTAATDGERVYVNPYFLAALSADERKFILAHETWHCALLHFSRRGERARWRWNLAVDHEVNDLLRTSGMRVPEDAVLFSHLSGMQAERVYGHLERRERRRAGRGFRGGKRRDRGRLQDVHLGDGSGNEGVAGSQASDGCEGAQAGTGGLERSGTRWPRADWIDAVAGKIDPIFRPTMAAGQTRRWRERAVMVARRFGASGLPDALGRVVVTALRPKVPWQAVLARFVRQTGGGELTWSRPNRRHVHRGLYLPGRKVAGLRLAVAIDTSGSTRADMERFVAELRGILAAVRRFEVRVLWCDAVVHRDEVFSDVRGLTTGGVEVGGGGGTDFRPVFERLVGWRPDGLVFFTDGAGPAPAGRPGYPVLWALTAGGERPVRWGAEVDLGRVQPTRGGAGGRRPRVRE